MVQVCVSAIHRTGPGNTESENLRPVSIPRMPVEHLPLLAPPLLALIFILSLNFWSVSPIIDGAT